MVARAPNPFPESDPESDEEGISLHDVKEIAGFVLRAPRRRPKLAIAAFVIACGLGVTAAIAMPNAYNSQVKLLAQQNLVGSLTNPGSAVPHDVDSATKNVGDQIVRRDNMIALAKETNLVERYYANRSAPLKLKDKILAGQMSEEDKLKIVVATLETKVNVTTENNNVTISVDWYSPDVAFDLVSKLQENFQAARYDDDVAMIKDAITVLEQHAKDEADAVDNALDEYRKVVAEASAPPPVDPKTPAAAPTVVVRRRLAPPPTAAHPVPASLSPEIAEQLETKRMQIRAIEEGRAKELEQLRQQLAQAQLTLTPQHPTIIALQQKIDSFNEPDPQLAQLKAEERSLMQSIAAPTSDGPSPGSSTTYTTTLVPAPVLPKPESTLGTPREDPKVALQRAKLEGTIRRYQDAVSRIDSANVELEVARTAFKHRYTVITPPEVPSKPKKPMKTIVGVSSVLGSLLLAFLIAAGADLASGRVIEEWQVRRRLKIDVLGEIDPRRQLPSRTA